jgi:hypothetical protein
MEEAPVILDNERDKRTWKWLQNTVEAEQLEQALLSLAGKRKPYVSNLCKILDLEPPEEVRLGMSKKEYAQMHLEKAKAILKGVKKL